ncbi:class I SAM-dependent methyltransferase [Hyalangium versicolor]|uniref:class I SAM-dependent methyltransferase n=1 Tax=Hyalangium versicolor TaxID=2861190 RepID=UPI001CCA38A2|nr:class I SAM-dependent methyltransferase [Hyalangium versicolor]
MSGRHVNIHACLVHESRESVIDLVRNLHHLDPDSLLLLYNGGPDPSLLRGFPFERYNAIVHPSPRLMRWGWLHDFALDCFRFALESHPFDTMTIVDSDQLGMRPGYSEFLGRFLSRRSRVGLLGLVQTPQTEPPWAAPMDHAWQEFHHWRPFLRRFPDGESKFVHRTFWPSTIFTSDAARDLLELWEHDAQLQDLLDRTHIWASEEILFPTMLALLGYEVAQSPCRYDLVQFRTRYSTEQLDAAFEQPDLFWIHPVPRSHGDPLRAHIRARFGGYEAPASPASTLAPASAHRSSEGHEASRPSHPHGLLLTWPILNEVRGIEGWLSPPEADLLIAVASRAITLLPSPHTLVEVGSFCGKATILLGRVVEALGSEARIHAIDPFDGIVGARDRGLQHQGPTRERFEQNLRAAGLTDRVKIHPKAAPRVPWSEPISLLLIDGLHDYASVSSDFQHLEQWVVDGGYVAFHDYTDHFPGVKQLVHELLQGEHYQEIHCAEGLMVLRKTQRKASQGKFGKSAAKVVQRRR